MNDNHENNEKENKLKVRTVKIKVNIPTKREMIMMLAYIPLHLVFILLILSWAMDKGALSEPQANLVLYGIGVVYMLVFAGGFLRRDFDPLCDHPIHVGLTVLGSYGLMLCCNFVLALGLTLLGFNDNPNNGSVQELSREALGTMTAVTVYLTPIVEELMFRGAIFGALRWRSRTAAYIVTMLSFSICHVWGYALLDASYWIYVLQYLPASWILCRCYERTNTIWGSILLHMLINGIAMGLTSMI